MADFAAVFGDAVLSLPEWAAASAAMIALVAAVRFLLRRQLGPRLRYALWLLVLLRLLLPVSLTASAASVLNLLAAEPVPPAVSDYVAGAAGPVVGVIGGDTPELSVSDSPDMTPEQYEQAWKDWREAVNAVRVETGGRAVTLADVVTGVWLAGMAATGAALLAVNLKFYVNLRRRRRAAGEYLGLHVYEADGLFSPCLFGTAIYLTPGLEERERGHALAHEYIHRRQGDAIWSLLRGVCLVLHWYDPLAWWAAAASRRDGELSCDAGTVALLGEEERADYGRTLVALVTRRTMPADLLRCATTMTGGKSSLKERIASLVARRRTTAAAACLAAALAGVCALCAFTGAVERREVPEDGEGQGEALPPENVPPEEDRTGSLEGGLPTALLASGDQAVLLGARGYDWAVDGGAPVTLETPGAAVERQDELAMLSAGPGAEVGVTFPREPIQVTARGWYVYENRNCDPMDLSVTGTGREYTLTVDAAIPADLAVELTAVFPTEDGSGGTAQYAVYLDRDGYPLEAVSLLPLPEGLPTERGTWDTPFRLLAQAPDTDIALYCSQGGDIVYLRRGDVFQAFRQRMEPNADRYAWWYEDADGDGEREFVAAYNNIYPSDPIPTLVVYEWQGDHWSARTMDPSALIGDFEEKVTFTTDSGTALATVNYGGSEALTAIPRTLEDPALSCRTTGSISFAKDGDGWRLDVGGGIYTQGKYLYSKFTVSWPVAYTGDGFETGEPRLTGGDFPETEPDGSARERLAYTQFLESPWSGGGGYVNEDWDSYTFSDYAPGRFAVCDVDGDGRRELLMEWTAAITPGDQTFIIDCDGVSHGDSLWKQQAVFGSNGVRFWSNGAVEVPWSHNQGYIVAEGFWPHRLCQYVPGSERYIQVGDVRAWDRPEEDSPVLDEFPDEADADGDGRVYYVDVLNGGGAIDGPEYEAWLAQYIEGAEILDIPWVELTGNNIRNLAVLFFSEEP